jgi:hypothetical protein
MRKELALVALLLIGSCTNQQQRFADFRVLAERFVRAAATLEPLALSAMATDSVPVQQILGAAKAKPELLRAASRGLKPRIGEVRGDTAVVDFTFEQEGGEGTIGFRFENRDGRWLVDRVQTSDWQ